MSLSYTAPRTRVEADPPHADAHTAAPCAPLAAHEARLVRPQVLSADVPALDGYVKHAFNGVLVGVDSSFQAVHAYGDAIYQIFSEHGNPSLEYSLRSLRVRRSPSNPPPAQTPNQSTMYPCRVSAHRVGEPILSRDCGVATLCCSVNPPQWVRC
jgi:hypothetical protein